MKPIVIVFESLQDDLVFAVGKCHMPSPASYGMLCYMPMQISTLEILNPEDQGALLSDDEIFSSRQTAKHTCMALRRYFEAHLSIKVEQVKQSLQRTEGGAPIHPQPYYKVKTTMTFKTF